MKRYYHNALLVEIVEFYLTKIVVMWILKCSSMDMYGMDPGPGLGSFLDPKASFAYSGKQNIHPKI